MISSLIFFPRNKYIFYPEEGKPAKAPVGHMRRKEFKNVMEKLLGMETAEAQMEKLFQKVQPAPNQSKWRGKREQTE